MGARRLEAFRCHFCRPPPHLDSRPVSGFGTVFAGKTKWGRRLDAGGGIAVGFLSRDISAWIPAFAGMTNGGVRWRTRKPFERIPDRSPGHAFTAIGHPGCRRPAKV